MNRFTMLLLGMILFFNAGQLWAAVEDLSGEETTESVNAFLRNEFILENMRLLKLAEDSYTGGRYDEAIQYAEQASQFAQRSDDFIRLQLLIREANETMTTAQSRLDLAKRSGAPRAYPEVYEKAEVSFAEALEAHSRENWGASLSAARQTIAILNELPEHPVFAAQYRVRHWNPTRDCLWNIAAKPEIYNDPTQWRRIYNANRNKLPDPDNPDLVHPDTILDIPAIGGEIRMGLWEE